MKIALLGYGKMGKTIEKLAVEAGHTIVYKSGSSSQSGNLKLANVAIEFSTPETAIANITQCFENNIPVVSGTTGWLSKKADVEKICKERNGSFIYASNFSVGVNLFFELNKQLAKLMKPWKEYTASIEEIHHIEKKDAPSGTAITLAEGIIENHDSTNWSLDKKGDGVINISAKREPEVKGTHTIEYMSQIDTISITHEAHTRDGFAKGAIIAAEFLQDKKGIFSMKEVLGI
ncbi:4-hydroxy-tetrahydrodipicolinate reductase [Patiriisocius marinistellae]|uniref:4-hydroxy-tetrahydrodipicolinate reductase n=1 Tax=Patiriisocius marinistellae TaxID=2494560 RepID=A0A5J4FVP7_9FLAO|nr:4-hydroxy-tetrahydrodipicolinate reductase [Patiriisocius marinistellae]GEQ86090.1 4-hydroxy-tetrahydrodipicolinate reductase [Patiriisocius marinistellae]